MSPKNVNYIWYHIYENRNITFLTKEKFYWSLFQVPCSLFVFYECNGQRCNNGEVMSSDHHVIGSGFADDVNVINVTATDFHHQSILLRNCPFHLSFRGGSNMFLVKFSVLVMQRENQNDYWWFCDDQCCRCLTSNIVRGEIEFKFPIKNSPSGYPPLFEGLCIRRKFGSIQSRSPHRQPSSETKYWKSRLQTTSEIWKIYQIGSDPGLEIFPDNVLGLPKVNWVLSFVHSSSTSLNNIFLDL